jgi:hypothetical protein
MIGLIWVVGSMVGFVAGIVGVKFLLQPASSLRLNVFRPWRGDPWPQGVQEDYDARFVWSAARKRRTPIVPSWDDIIVTPSMAQGDVDPDPADMAPQELPDGAVMVEHLRSVDVHHPRH